MLAPSATAKAAIDKLHVEMVKAMRLADVKERFFNLGAEPVGNTPAEFGVLRSEVKKWAKIVKEAGIRLD